jgi:hypothetical protein
MKARTNQRGALTTLSLNESSSETDTSMDTDSSSQSSTESVVRSVEPPAPVMGAGLELPQVSTSAAAEDFRSMIALFSSKADELLRIAQAAQSQIDEVKELRGEVEGLRSHIQVQNLPVKAIGYKIDAQHARLELQDMKLQALGAQLGAQQSKLDTQTAQINAQSAQLQDQKSEIAELHGIVSRLETRVDSLAEDSIKCYKMRIRNFLSYAKAKSMTFDRDCLLQLNVLNRLVHGADSVLDSKAMMELDLLSAEPEMSAFIEVYGIAPHTILDIRKLIPYPSLISFPSSIP